MNKYTWEDVLTFIDEHNKHVHQLLFDQEKNRTSNSQLPDEAKIELTRNVLFHRFCNGVIPKRLIQHQVNNTENWVDAAVMHYDLTDKTISAEVINGEGQHLYKSLGHAAQTLPTDDVDATTLYEQSIDISEKNTPIKLPPGIMADRKRIVMGLIWLTENQ